MTATHPTARRAAPESARRPSRWIAAGVLVALALAVLVVPAVVQLDQQLVDLRAANQAPSPAHLFGTDEVGRDVLLRVIYGLRVSLLIGLVAALVSITIGTVAGLAAGTLGGAADRVIMRVVDGFNSVPHLLFGIFIVALFSPSATAVIASVGLTHWTTAARIVRSEVLTLRGRPFVDAAISGGSSRLRIVRRHFLPHLIPHIALASVLMVPHAIWHETALSFLGLGLPPHLASLGNMINDGARSLLAGNWWASLFPGLFILLPTLAISVLVQYWRDRANPRWRSELQL
ncbi:ABC transporter permease [Acrocarpospora phusangensis]|uniref:ABC transporter permease n=1 Tax=Acrocarpospora phusangensis TaxID=1070424 RepID=A0A919Q6Z9_9ACTN|nr:ABC transporter permease [Acrocarpospora phusangensis]GIH22716.1 ABC transporter permease [Acrocarpospora phusangensis]